MIASFSRLSLLWKIMLSTSVAITLLFALTGWIVLRSAVQTTTSTMEDEVGASFQAYQSLWEARAELLASVSLVVGLYPKILLDAIEPAVQALLAGVGR